MNEIINLIWLTHPTALNDAITVAHEESPEDAERECGFLFGQLLSDDTFNGYSESELEAAISEAISEYY